MVKREIPIFKIQHATEVTLVVPQITNEMLFVPCRGVDVGKEISHWLGVDDLKRIIAYLEQEDD